MICAADWRTQRGSRWAAVLPSLKLREHPLAPPVRALVLHERRNLAVARQTEGSRGRLAPGRCARTGPPRCRRRSGTRAELQTVPITNDAAFVRRDLTAGPMPKTLK